MSDRPPRLKFLGGIGRVLGIPNCAIYLSGMFVSLNGSFIYFVTMGWLTWEITNSAAWVGTLVIAESIPNAILAPLAGTIIDRNRPMIILRLSQWAQAIVMCVLTMITYFDAVTIEWLLASAIILGAGNGFAVPAHFACIPKMVPRQELSAILALQSGCAQSARFIGPAVAGIFLVTTGAVGAFAFNAITFFIYIAALQFVRIDDQPEPDARKQSVLSGMSEGFTYTWNSLSLRAFLLLAICAAVFLRPLIDLMPAYVGDVMDGGPTALAWILSTAGGAAVLATIWLALRGGTRGLTRIMLVGFVVTASTTIAFPFQDNLVIGVGLIFIYGFAAAALSVTNMSLIQLTVEDRMRARVMGIFSLTHRAIPAVGAFAVGQIASITSLPLPIVGGAAISLAFWWWLQGVIRHHNIEQIGTS